ncbi:hypothetical protein [Streptacidiphilus pinicola]|uniref:esterase/lipase family protein n=1 Tax=Streptacidiphilus pinicola TaxID=2219663 RepID=UPI00311FF4D0
MRNGPDAIVTLVPGTWAGKAAWTQADSPLSRALTAAGCEVAPFEWSHSNSFRARMRAAVRLADQIQGRIKENPDARQWIVAHSHGGNVALHAVRLLRRTCTDAPRVSTVTLATPFIHVRRRAISGWSVFVLAMFGVGVIALAAVTLAGGHWRDWPYYVSALVLGEALLCIGGGAMHRGFLQRGNLFIWLGRRITANPGGWLYDVIDAVSRGDFIRRGYQRHIFASVQSPKVAPDELIVLRAAGDEASLGLATGQFLGWISALLSRPLTNFWLWLCITGAVRVFLLAGVVIHRPSHLAVRIVIYASMAPGFVALAAVSVMLAAAVPFGWDGPFLAMFASYSAEAVPPGQTTVVQLEPPAEAGSKGLAHSRLYRSEQGINMIVTLICGPPPADGDGAVPVA